METTTIEIPEPVAACECKRTDIQVLSAKRTDNGTSLVVGRVVCRDCGEVQTQLTPQGYDDVFRLTFGAGLKDKLSASRVAKPKPKPEKKPAEKKPELADGPGKELMLVFAGLGVPSCQACKELAEKMNSEGIEWCEANVDAIVADILPRAQEWLARPEGGWTDKFKARAPQFAQAAVLRRYVGIALRSWRDKLDIQSET